MFPMPPPLLHPTCVTAGNSWVLVPAVTMEIVATDRIRAGGGGGRARSGCSLLWPLLEVDVPNLIRTGVTYCTLHKSQDGLGEGSGSAAAAHKPDTGRNPGVNSAAAIV